MIDMTIKVNFGVTQEFIQLATMLAGMRVNNEQPVKAIPTESEKPIEVQPEKVEDPKEETPKVEAASEKKENKVEVGIPTPEDVRAAIDRARSRIEGDDYKGNTESEGYKKYHRALTSEFKSISRQIAQVEKPSELPEACREKFIIVADDLYINDKGAIAQKIPF